MKTLKILVILSVITSCTQDDIVDVSSLDQIHGLWEWESTCGGIIATCGYPSDSSFQTIEFTDQYQFIEKHNDTLYFCSSYSISKENKTEGRLILYVTGKDDTLSNRPISLFDNRLIISAGELGHSYIKK